ncbi:MAG: YfhO family protein [Myxococcales bacterium]
MNRRAWMDLGGVLLVISALAVVVFWPAFDPDQGDVVGRYDVHRQFGPWNYFFDYSIQHGDFPEWDPLVFSGAPHAANPQSWAFYPPNLLRALLHTDPTPLGTLRGLSVLMGLHLLFWALGVFQLARSHGLARDGALLAAIAASFSALMVRRVGEYHFIFTLAALPWMLLCIRKLVLSQRAEKAQASAAIAPVLGLAVLFAGSVLGGFLQVVPHLVVAMTAYLLSELSLSGAAREERVRLWSRTLGWLALAGALAVGLASVLLVPASELLAHSPRASGSGVDVGGHKPEAWNLLYAARSLIVYSGRIFEPETLRGAGIVFLALLLCALVQRSWRGIAPFVAMSYALVDLMLGRPWPLSSLIAALSPVQLVSGTRAFDVAMLPLAILAGFGLANLRRSRFAAPGVAAAIALCGVIVLERQLAANDVWARPDAIVWWIPLAFVGLLILWMVVPSRAALWSALVVLLMASELLSWSRFYSPRMLVRPGFDADWKARDGFTGVEPLWPHNRRETTDRENFSLFSLRGISNGYDPLHLRSYREAVSGRTKLQYRRTLRERETVTETPRGHLFLKRAFWLVPSVVYGPMPLGQRMFPPTALAFVTSEIPKGFPVVSGHDIPFRASSEHVQSIPLVVQRRSRSLYSARAPRLAPVHHVLLVRLMPTQDDSPEVATQYRDQAVPRPIPGYRHRPRTRAGQVLELIFPMPDVVEPRIDLELKSQDPGLSVVSMELLQDLADEDALIHVERRSADSVDLRVDNLPGPRLLAFIDVDYPGWQVVVDGKPAELAQVNDSFKGVWLAPGPHRVSFQFASSSLRKGAVISGISALSCLLLGVFAVLQRRRSARPAQRGDGQQADPKQPDPRAKQA